MILGARILTGYPSELPALKERKFLFLDGINFLFGPNGCGKSSLLRTIAAYSFIPNGYAGWSRQPIFTPIGEYPHACAENAPGKATANVVWDGNPSFLLDSSHHVAHSGHLEYNADKSVDGLTDLQVQLTAMRSSQGQINLMKLNIASEKLKITPNLIDVLVPKYQRDNPTEESKNLLAYLESLPRDGRPTLFLDEPDRSLSLLYQRNLFHSLLIDLSHRFQVICATHSPMCFYVPGAVYHDLQDGYLQESQVLMHMMFGDDRLAKMLVMERD